MLLERIQLKNLLSFGPDTEEFELRPLNVLIGPNGSGKSNFIEAIGLLQAAPTDLARPMRTGRGVADWIWQGEPQADSARIEAVVNPTGQQALRYSVEFGKRDKRFAVVDERLEALDPAKADPCILRVPRPSADQHGGCTQAEQRPEDNSILAQVKNNEHHPEVTCLAQEFAHIGLHREWTFGHNNVVRSAQRTDLSSSNLAENGCNLGLVLHRLSRDDKVRERMVNALRQLYQDVADFHVSIESDTVQVFVQEQEGKVTVPATRLSDGTIRYLSLLTMLCDPHPPPLVCIEEPELGVHPDILPGLAELLVEATTRCQLVVTTHSDVLVDALTDEPESVVVCEKQDGQTQLSRLNASEMKYWLDKYRLGELWCSGEIGGNRW